MDTDTTPRIQLLNRSNFATDAIFLSFPPAGWAPLIQLADLPRFQTLLCSPSSLTNHLPPCQCDRAEPWRFLCGTCWRCLRVTSPLDAVTAEESAWPADSSCSSSKPLTPWWVCPSVHSCVLSLCALENLIVSVFSVAVQPVCAQQKIRCAIFGDFERKQWQQVVHLTLEIQWTCATRSRSRAESLRCYTRQGRSQCTLPHRDVAAPAPAVLSEKILKHWFHENRQLCSFSI